MKKISCSIIGCGRISRRHIDVILKSLQKKFKIISVCDIDKSKAEATGKMISVPYFNNMKEMINHQIADIACILTESGNHPSHIVYLSKYYKNIIVEKPLSLNIKGAKQAIHACKKNKCRLFVVKQNRFNPAIVQLKNAIVSKRFKKIFLVTTRVRWTRKQNYYDQAKWRGTKKLDVNVIANQASHHIDLLLWLNGEVKSVFAYSKKSLAKIEMDDTVIAILKFKNNSLGCIEATTATRPEDLEGSITVLGEGGSVEIAGFAVNKIKTWKFLNNKTSDKKILLEYNENPPNVYGYGHIKFYENIYKSINNKRISSIDGNEGMKSVILLEAINKSLDLKKEINL